MTNNTFDKTKPKVFLFITHEIEIKMKQDQIGLLLSTKRDQTHITIENKSYSIITKTFPREDKLNTSADKTTNTIKISAKSKVIR